MIIIAAMVLGILVGGCLGYVVGRYLQTRQAYQDDLGTLAPPTKGKTQFLDSVPVKEKWDKANNITDLL